MEYMREMGDEEVKTELRRFKGVGAKTISCVLMFCLKRADFPVDTHVWKIGARGVCVLTETRLPVPPPEAPSPPLPTLN